MLRCRKSNEFCDGMEAYDLSDSTTNFAIRSVALKLEPFHAPEIEAWHRRERLL
jgi:hypothetical protein